jgi:hypothetical protein
MYKNNSDRVLIKARGLSEKEVDTALRVLLRSFRLNSIYIRRSRGDF